MKVNQMMMRKFSLLTLVLVVGAPVFESNVQADDEDASKILQRAIEAVGGRFGGLQGPMLWMEKGTYYADGVGVGFVTQYASKWPDWFRREVEGVFTITVNGDKAWLTNEQGAQNFKDSLLEEALKQNRLNWALRLFPLKDKAYTLKKIDGVEVLGRPTVGFEASHVDGGEFKFYFDKETYLIAKTETIVITPMAGPEPVLAESFYSAHRSLAGAKMPSKVTLHYDGKRYFDAEIVASKVAATLDPALFEAPE